MRAGLGAIAPELEERGDGLLALAARSATGEIPPPRLLGSYEPVLLGWASREPLIEAGEAIVAAGGIFRPFALVDGRAAAIWSLRDGQVAIEPFGRLERADARALDDEAADVLRFLAGA